MAKLTLAKCIKNAFDWKDKNLWKNPSDLKAGDIVTYEKGETFEVISVEEMSRTDLIENDFDPKVRRFFIKWREMFKGEIKEVVSTTPAHHLLFIGGFQELRDNHNETRNKQIVIEQIGLNKE